MDTTIKEVEMLNELPLKYSELRYRRLFEAAQDGILILDAKTGMIEDVNPYLIKMLGYSREEFVEKKLWEVGAFKDIEASQSAFEALKENKYIRYDDLPLKTKNGKLIQVEFVSNVYSAGSDKVIQCNIRDISARKQAEQALQESEARYRRLFEAAQDGILLVNAGTGTIEDVNPFLTAMLGYSHAEFMQKKLWDLRASEDVKASQEAFELLQKNEYIRYEDLPLQTKDGRLIQVEFVSNIYLVGNEKVIQCNVRDITQRRQAEKQVSKRIAEMEMLYESGLTLSQLLSQKEVGQSLIALIEQKMDWHHTAIRIYHPQDETLELLAFSPPNLDDERLYGKTDEGLNDLISRPGEGLSGWAVQNSQIVRSVDVSNDPRHKETYSGMQSGIYVPIKSGQNAMGVITIESEKPNTFSEEDERLLATLASQAAIAFENAELYQTAQLEIAERKRIETLLADEKYQLAQRVEERTADLSKANLELAYALRVKDEFLASMSHELRTPLTSILGFSEALQLETYGELNAMQRKTLSTIQESGRHLLDLINDVLDLAKIEAHKEDLQFSPCSVGDICQAALQLTRGMAQQKNQIVHYSPLLKPLFVRADERRLKQILVNLLSNAIKFAPEMGELGLEVQPDDSEQNIKLIVWDKGIGINPEDMRKLFTPFVQIDHGLARQYNGSGLGLSLVKRLVELHNGGLEMESTVGEGSSFTVILPWSPEDTVPSRLALPPDPTKDADLISADHTFSPSILIADDNDVILQMLADFLESHQCQVIKTHTGFELLKQAAEFHPDLMLVDIQMPVMDGLETIRRIRSHADKLLAATPVIAVTALAMPGDRERCLQAGANEYVSKPMKLLDLASIIKKLLEKTE